MFTIEINIDWLNLLAAVGAILSSIIGGIICYFFARPAEKKIAHIVSALDRQNRNISILQASLRGGEATRGSVEEVRYQKKLEAYLLVLKAVRHLRTVKPGQAPAGDEAADVQIFVSDRVWSLYRLIVAMKRADPLVIALLQDVYPDAVEEVQKDGVAVYEKVCNRAEEEIVAAAKSFVTPGHDADLRRI